MEGNAYGYPSTPINLASGGYPYQTINPAMLSNNFVPPQNMDNGFQASQTNEPMETAQPDVHTRSSPYNTINPAMLSKDFVPSHNMDTGFQASQTNTPMEIAQPDVHTRSYPYHTINPAMLSNNYVPSQNMDTGFQASQTNTPMEIAQPDVLTQNNSLAADGTPPPAKKRRGRPLGSKNKVKVNAPLDVSEQPEPQRKPRVSKQKAKVSPESAPDAQEAGLSLPQGVDTGTSQLSIARNQDNANQSLHLTVDQTHPGTPPQAGAATAVPTEGAMENVISPIEPIRAFNVANGMQHPTMSHRKHCPCRGCYIYRPHEDKKTTSGAPFDLFASIVGEAAAAVHTRNEQHNHHMDNSASLPPAEFQDIEQLESAKDSLDTDMLLDRHGNPITALPSRSTIKEQALRMMNQKLQELERRNLTFTVDPPCVKKGTVNVQEYIMYEIEGGRNVVDDPM